MIRADWEAATPKCPGIPTNFGHRTCGRMLSWEAAGSWWCCPDHGPVFTGYQAAARWAPELSLTW